MEQHEKAFIEELKYCLRNSDVIKARAALQFFPEASAKTQDAVLDHILKGPDAVAFPLLECLSRLPVTAADMRDKITVLLYEKSYNNAARIIDSIRSKDTKDRRLYVSVAGNLRLDDALPELDGILRNETDEDLLLEALAAIGRIGAATSIPVVASFLGSSNKKLKLAAIGALAEIGGPSSIKKLCETLTGQSDTDMAVVDTLARIQDHQCLERLAELLSSRFVDLRIAAIDHLIAIGPKAIPFVTECLKSDDDTVIHSLAVLGKIGDVTALPAVVKVIHNEPANPNVRFAVYEAMERLPSTRSAVSLAQGLTDPVEHVSMAAAKAIDNNLSTILVAGLRNMVEAKDDQSAKIVATLVDAGADNVFGFLLDSEVFQSYAVEHLAKHAHPKTVEHFIGVLDKRGLGTLIARIRKQQKPESSHAAVRIMAVDDSKTMLKIYMRMLHAMGFEALAHELPAQALVAAKAHKPDLLITDLNMPGMNGLELSEHVRELYSARDLPILLITTQSDVLGQGVSSKGGGSDGAIKKAGIDMVLSKPFQAPDLQNAVNRLLGR